MPRKITELDKKIYKYLLKKGKEGVPQNVLWKELKISSRDASRSLKKLEELGFVKRKPIVYNGRRTFRVYIVKGKKLENLTGEKTIINRPTISIDGFTEIPCMYCPYIDMCYEGGFYDPTNCDLIMKWIKENIAKARHK
ncbi:MAG: AsnC family transcriptional regulator [Desulfurococcales archaeon ex4484_58]|nr:MAG: AsnC family transcriptional regulator [Desulfurococcales archaeon ex4484_58]